MLEAGGVAVTGEVEPMAAPLFAVTGGGQELVERMLPGLGGWVAQECVDLGLGGRQAEQIIAGALEQRETVSWWAGRDAGGPELLVEKGVHGIRGASGSRHLFEGPPLVHAGGRGAGPFGARVDPGLQDRDLMGRQSTARGGHPQNFSGTGDGFEQEAIDRLSRDHRRTTGATAKQSLAAGYFEA